MKTMLDFLRNSIRLPQKEAVFTLNREGFGLPIVFLCFILLLVSLPLGVQMALSGENMAAEVALPIFLVFFFFVYYPFFVLSVLIPLAAITLLALLVAKFAHRKMNFFMLYKIAAFAAILPVIGLGITILIGSALLETIWIGISIVYLTVILIRVVFIYPKRKSAR
ncbi:hypothetical protein [Geomicrobium sediminis]|uniref:Asparagine N-glycosylation enzyme membrane subunit Stt3 n=2 Tax=Geomicrobium TaxID=767528 RepID=A0ABS2PD03_9BACL|nr:hypothetical protein [Geomicrobium sediminis]MBM7632935.1 asparagine N-glycosylation enzyme membrane subunit Stt3 [Geomicrobium sediminis]